MVAFKKTEIGILPEDWRIVKLADVVSYIDYGFSQAIPKTPIKDGIKIISTADISKDGNLLYHKVRNISAPDKTISRLTLQEGDVLFNWRNTAELIGKSAVFQTQPEPHIFASFILRIKCDEAQSNNYFLCHLMNYFRQKGVFVNLARRAVNQANYNKNEISVLPLPLPSLIEQDNIVKVLFVIKSAIETQEKVIETTTVLKKALMQKLFTEGLDGERQKKSEIGLVPMSWRVIEFKEIASMQGGYAFKSSEGVKNSNVQLLRMGNLYQNRLDLSRAPIFYPENFIKKYQAFVLNPNDLVISLTGTMGKEDYGFTVKLPSKLDRTLLLNQRIARINIKSKDVIKDYLFYLLLSRKFLDVLYKTAKGTKQANLSTNTIMRILLAIPTEREQERIVEVLSSVDGRIEFAEKKLRILNLLFQSILQRLMTGQIRVKDLSL